MSRQENRTYGTLNSERRHFQFMLVVSICSNSLVHLAKTGMYFSVFLFVFLLLFFGQNILVYMLQKANDKHLMIGKPALQVNQRKG